MRKYILIISALLFVALYWSSVDNEVTDVDRVYIEKILDGERFKVDTYYDEIDTITRIQKKLISLAPKTNGIPKNSPREPKDVYEFGGGLCYDRSRAIEKIFRYVGFEVRHVGIYSMNQISGGWLVGILTPGSSHAVTEVKTKRGWVVVDSNVPWVSIQENGNPASIQQISNDAENTIKELKLGEPYPAGIYQKKFIYVYGLYSRHGRFYPPYNFIPDVNYQELLQNFM